MEFRSRGRWVPFWVVLGKWRDWGPAWLEGKCPFVETPGKRGKEKGLFLAGRRVDNETMFGRCQMVWRQAKRRGPGGGGGDGRC